MRTQVGGGACAVGGARLARAPAALPGTHTTPAAGCGLCCPGCTPTYARQVPGRQLAPSPSLTPSCCALCCRGRRPPPRAAPAPARQPRRAPRPLKRPPRHAAHLHLPRGAQYAGRQRQRWQRGAGACAPRHQPQAPGHSPAPRQAAPALLLAPGLRRRVQRQRKPAQRQGPLRQAKRESEGWALVSSMRPGRRAGFGCDVMVEGIPPQGLGGGWGRKAVLRGIWCCRLGRSVRVQGASAQAKLH